MIIDIPELPHDLDAERAVLGCVLLNNEALGRIGSLQVGDLYAPAHRRVLEIMRLLHSKGDPIDPVTVGTVARDRADGLDSIGGTAIFDRLSAVGATTGAVESYARTVRELSARRTCIQTCVECARDGVSASDAGLYLSSVSERIGGVVGVLTRSDIKTLDDVCSEVWEEIENGGQGATVKTGIGDLDFIAGGMPRGLVTILAGRPGMGKSAVLVNVAVNVARDGGRVLVTSLEDTRLFLGKRIVSRATGIKYGAYIHHQIRPDQHSAVIDSLTDLRGLPLYIDDKAGQTPGDIRQTATSLKLDGGLDLLIIDHLGELGDDDRAYASVSKAARQLRDIAKDLDIPVLLASQLNRKVEDRPDKRPMISDLRDSGKIEEIARNIWLLYRPAYYDETASENELEILIAKATHGRTGKCTPHIDLSRMAVGDGQY